MLYYIIFLLYNVLRIALQFILLSVFDELITCLPLLEYIRKNKFFISDDIAGTRYFYG